MFNDEVGKIVNGKKQESDRESHVTRFELARVSPLAFEASAVTTWLHMLTISSRNFGVYISWWLAYIILESVLQHEAPSARQPTLLSKQSCAANMCQAAGNTMMAMLRGYAGEIISVGNKDHYFSPTNKRWLIRWNSAHIMLSS